MGEYFGAFNACRPGTGLFLESAVPVSAQLDCIGTLGMTPKFP